jgi:hypothetical protein
VHLGWGWGAVERQGSGRGAARTIFVSSLFAAWIVCGSFAQYTSAQPDTSSAGSSSVRSKGPGNAGQATQKSAPAGHPPLTKQQAEELFRSVDDILKFASEDTGLPIQHTVKRKLITRAEVNKYLTEKFSEDEGAKRLQRSEIVLKKFGLLDHDFHLRPFLVSLLTEQVAGFYDNKTKTVNLLDWIDPDEQKPVLAHELTHALQDQKVDLTKWSDVSSSDIAHNVKDDNQHLQTDEEDTARDAVTEGQAMAVFVDYALKPSGKTLADSPEVADRMKESLSDTSGSPILARAPLLLQQSLLFPYSEGLNFVQSLLVKGGKQAAFAGMLANPPSSSFEIMNPDAYLAHVPVPVLQLPDIHPLIDPEYTPYDVGVMGEFDVRILTELFGGRQIANALTPAWNGGIYYAAQRKSAVTPEAKASTASLGLIYYSKWKTEGAANGFLRVYTGQLPRKYSGLKRRPEDEAGEGEQVYSTDEGDVFLSIAKNGVFTSEGFPVALARKLRDSIVTVQLEGPLQIAALPPVPLEEATYKNDPALSIVDLLSSAGVVKAAIGGERAAGGRSGERYTLVRP